jgi:hypothetical protein
MFRSATIAPAARAATTVKTFILAYPAIAYESSFEEVRTGLFPGGKEIRTLGPM